MRLTVYTDYALRVLMYLALKEGSAGDNCGDRRQLWHLQEPFDESGTSIGRCGLC